MFAQELCQGPVFRQVAGIPEDDLVVVDADLDGDAAAVVLVDHGVEQGLAEGGLREEEGLAPLQAVVADVGLEIFGGQEVEGLLHLLEEVAVDLVLIAEVVVGQEEADLDPGTAHEPLGAVGEEQAGGAFEAVLLDQLQVAEDGFPAVAQDRAVHAPARSLSA